ncbi:uncharacterized protein LOC128552654 [Mercenaria mercenaria]|uniref:uncharacterized protein LOC128552654 n=1 Tax=Mercenaria mercenaria TaxID=6596 RepID=UPI00234EA476|nr:uncharacterized protein LOC128552654 [Mercenaria mercenaria]
MFSVQCQVPYNLVKRKHAAVQENPKMCTREVQTDVVLSVPEADRHDMDSTLHSSMYSYKSKEDPEWLPLDDSTLSEQSFQQEHVNEAKERKFIVFETELDKLFRLCRKCNRELIMEKYVSGTFVKVTTTCSTCVENEEWSSQPMSGSMAFGNLILGAAILFSGLSPGKALKMMAFAGIQTFCERAFSVYQRIYYVPSVMSVWTSHQARLADTVSKAGRTVKLGGDARCDSPGHTAKYGSYSVMDLEKNKILDCQLVQSNEVKNSHWMELEGLKRCLRYMSDVGIRVSHLVTDRHVQVKKYMREEQPTITHWFDVWHVAKGIFKKLQAVGKKKGCEKVQQWARSISNHLYWCAASSDGDEQLLTDKWLSILNHIQNIHTGHGERFPECLHDILEDRLWMKKGYRPYQETSKIVASKHLLKDIGKLSPAEQTSSLEAFHKVVCQFAPKFVHYDHPQMEARLCIASLHFNENANRAQATKKDGSLQFSVSYPRGRDTGVAKEVKVEMTYDYVDELMAEVLFCRETTETHSVALERRLQDETSWPSAGDGSRVCPVPLAQSTPYKQSKTELIQNRISRFNH